MSRVRRSFSRLFNLSFIAITAAPPENCDDWHRLQCVIAYGISFPVWIKEGKSSVNVNFHQQQIRIINTMNNRKMQKIWGAFRSLSVTSSTKHDGSMMSSSDDGKRILINIPPTSFRFCSVLQSRNCDNYLIIFYNINWTLYSRRTWCTICSNMLCWPSVPFKLWFAFVNRLEKWLIQTNFRRINKTERQWKGRGINQVVRTWRGIPTAGNNEPTPTEGKSIVPIAAVSWSWFWYTYKQAINCLTSRVRLLLRYYSRPATIRVQCVGLAVIFTMRTTRVQTAGPAFKTFTDQRSRVVITFYFQRGLRLFRIVTGRPRSQVALCPRKRRWPFSLLLSALRVESILLAPQETEDRFIAAPVAIPTFIVLWIYLSNLLGNLTEYDLSFPYEETLIIWFKVPNLPQRQPRASGYSRRHIEKFKRVLIEFRYSHFPENWGSKV